MELIIFSFYLDGIKLIYISIYHTFLKAMCFFLFLSCMISCPQLLTLNFSLFLMFHKISMYLVQILFEDVNVFFSLGFLLLMCLKHSVVS